jgi:hypothetical protein
MRMIQHRGYFQVRHGIRNEVDRSGKNSLVIEMRKMNASVTDIVASEDVIPCNGGTIHAFDFADDLGILSRVVHACSFLSCP